MVYGLVKKPTTVLNKVIKIQVDPRNKNRNNGRVSAKGAPSRRKKDVIPQAITAATNPRTG
jgi:hypothetical protein